MSSIIAKLSLSKKAWKSLPEGHKLTIEAFDGLLGTWLKFLEEGFGIVYTSQTLTDWEALYEEYDETVAIDASVGLKLSQLLDEVFEKLREQLVLNPTFAEFTENPAEDSDDDAEDTPAYWSSTLDNVCQNLKEYKSEIGDSDPCMVYGCNLPCYPLHTHAVPSSFSTASPAQITYL